MSKQKRGKYIKTLPNWRGTCPICGRKRVKLVWSKKDEERITQLETKNKELTDRITELENKNAELEASLEDRSHRPKTSPGSHTEQELRQIRRRLKKYKWTDLLLAYQDLIEKDGYTRSYGGFKRVVRSLKALKPDKRKKKKRKLKPYQRADYPGQKIQIDVKYVPSYCVTDGRKYYQYTAVPRHPAHSSSQILCPVRSGSDRTRPPAPFPHHPQQTHPLHHSRNSIAATTISTLSEALTKGISNSPRT